MGRWTLIVLTSLLNVTSANTVNAEKAVDAITQRSIRVAHAKELLGRSYKKSPVIVGEHIGEVRTLISNIALQSLPARYQHMAGAVTQTILDEANRHGFDPLALVSIIRTESGFNPDLIGGVGEIGLMQIRPETAEWMARIKKLTWRGTATLKNPLENIKYGAAYLAYLRDKFQKNGPLYIAAYNMGPTNVRRNLRNNRVPTEYLSKFLKHYYHAYRQLGPSALSSSFVVAQQ